MALPIKMFSLVIIFFFVNILFIEISGSDEAKKENSTLLQRQRNKQLQVEYQFEGRAAGSKAKTYKSISPRLGPEKGEINPAFIPKECRNMGICEEIPAGLEFNDIISRIDQSEKNKYLISEHQIDYEHRVGNNNTMPLCEAYNKTFKPSLALAKDSYWHRILNSENENIQTINGVVCRNDGGHCLSIDNVLHYDVSTGDSPPICTQNYTWRQLAYIGINKTIRHDKTFMVPISCTCKKNLFE